jgi:DNA-binding IclR family transcriptional regulator
VPINPSPAVVRACDLLGALAEHPDEALTVSELARRIGAPRATCDSLLLGLAERGLVRRRPDADRGYELGPQCIALGDAARTVNTVLAAAAAHAETLARDEAACVAVTTRERDGTRVAEVFDFGPPFGVRPRAGQSMALVPPFGAALVAWDGEPQQQAWLDRADPPLTEDEAARYRAALDAILGRGYSVSVSTWRQSVGPDGPERLLRDPPDDAARRSRAELIRRMAHTEYLAVDVAPDTTVQLTHLSAPVFDRDGRATAAIMIMGPSHEMSGAEVAALGDRIAAAAGRATRDVGGSGRARPGAP